MDRRNFVGGALGTTSLAFFTPWKSARAADFVVPFPRELGLPPLPIPASLPGAMYRFPVPPGCYINVWVQSNCEDKAVTREAAVTQYDRDGVNLLQRCSVTFDSYKNTDQTGVQNSSIFAGIDTTTWITLQYDLTDSLSAQYKVTQLGGKPILGTALGDDWKVLLSAECHQREGKFKVLYARNREAVASI